MACGHDVKSHNKKIIPFLIMFIIMSKKKSQVNTSVFLTPLISVTYSFFWLRGMWDLSSPTRDRNCTPCNGSAES